MTKTLRISEYLRYNQTHISGKIHIINENKKQTVNKCITLNNFQNKYIFLGGKTSAKKC